ncbi:MAG: hypothetical protein ACRC46_06310 [Thermoguttaceae bacterium]
MNPYTICAALIIALFCHVSVSNANDKRQSPQEIYDEISCFVDEDTAMVCRIDLKSLSDVQKLPSAINAFEKCHNFSIATKARLAQVSEALSNGQQKVADFFSPLTKIGIKHLYIIVNMRDLNFGPYFVIPSANNEDDSELQAVRDFFEVTNENKRSSWILKQDAYYIVGGNNNAVLLNIGFFYDLFIEVGWNLSFLSTVTNDCHLISDELFVAKLKERFDTLCKQDSPALLSALEKLHGYNSVKAVFLHPDSAAAWELGYLKRMGSPFDQISLDFLCDSREYTIIGINTQEPRMVIEVKTTSPEMAKRWEEFQGVLLKKLIERYFDFLSDDVVDESPNEPPPMTDEDWIDLCLLFLPKANGDRLVFTFDDYDNDRINIGQQ